MLCYSPTHMDTCTAFPFDIQLRFLDPGSFESCRIFIYGSISNNRAHSLKLPHDKKCFPQLPLVHA